MQIDFKGILDSLPYNNADRVFHERRNKNMEAFYMNFWENHPDLQILKEYNEIRWNILDFGCWTGNLDILSWLKITWIDTSPAAIAIANENKRVYWGDCEFILCDITKDKIEWKFDSVWSTQTFEHIDDPIKIFEWLKRVCNWYMLITVPLWFAYDDPDHVHHWTNESDVEDFFGKFAKIERIKIFNEFKIISILLNLWVLI